MPDVYCLFNRARGTELVSPDDLLQVPFAPVSDPIIWDMHAPQGAATALGHANAASEHEILLCFE